MAGGVSGSTLLLSCGWAVHIESSETCVLVLFVYLYMFVVCVFTICVILVRIILL